MKKLLLLLLGVLIALPALAFSYTYEGHTINYTIIDSEAKTCMTESATISTTGNKDVSGTVVLPAHPMYGKTEYTLIEIGDYSFNKHQYGGDLVKIIIPNTVTSIGIGAFHNCKNLTEVYIPNSVTSINENTFMNCTGLTEVTIPESVTSIGKSAFYGCSGLTSVNIPESVTSIDYRAFSGCRSLTEINIPNSVLTIGNEAFNGCSGLTEINIPNSVTSINYGAFWNCSGLTSVTIPNSVTSIGAWAFCGCNSLTEIYIPYSVTSIDYRAFNGCSSLQKITIPNSVKTIGNNAFQDCSGLTELTISNSLTYIDENTFSGCLGLRELNIPNSVTTIKESAFENCAGLRKITIGTSVKEIQKNAFKGCSEIEYLFYNAENCTSCSFPSTIGSVYFGESVKQIPAYAFSGCSSLHYIKFPSSGQRITINDHAFYRCTGLEAITLNNIDVGSYVFSNCTGMKEVTIEESVTLGNNAFDGCQNIDIFYYNAALKSYAYYAFYNFTPKAVYIGENVKSIPYDLKNKTGIKRAAYPATLENPFGSTVKTFAYSPGRMRIANQCIFDNSGTKLHFALCPQDEYIISGTVTEICDNAFADCSMMTAVKLPAGLKTIGNEAFANCTGLTSVDFPSHLESIGANAFTGSKLRGIHSSALPVPQFDITSFTDLYDTTYVTVPENLLGDYTNPYTDWSLFKNLHPQSSSIASIYEADKFAYQHITETDVRIVASEQYSQLTELTVPSTLKFLITPGDGDNDPEYKDLHVVEIGTGAFANLPNLTKATIAEGIRTISTTAFRGCTALTEVNLPSTVTEIASSTFEGCSALSTFIADLGITKVGAAAFAGTALTSVSFPFVTWIGDYAFADVPSITQFEPGVQLSFIGNKAFLNSGLTQLTFLGCNSLTIDDSAFASNANLTSVTLDQGVKSVGNNAFRDCGKLASLTIGKDLTSIGTNAFINSGLTELTLKNCNSLAIGESAFASNANLTTVTLGEGVKSVDNNAFKDCSKLKTVTIGKDVERIGDSAFEGTVIGTLTFAKEGALKEIGNLAFSGVRARGTLDLPDALEKIGDYAFQNPRMYTEIILPANRSLAIGKEAFAQAQRVTSIQFPETISSMGDGAFKDNAATELDVKCNNIGAEAFLGCNKLQKLTVTGAGTMGSRAFAELPELTEANIDIAEIGEYAFTAAPKLETVTLGDRVKIVGANSFLNSAALSSVTFGLGLERLGQYALKGTKVTDISFPSAAEPDPAIIVDELGFTLHSLSLGNRAKEINSDLTFTNDCEIYFGTTVEKMKTISVTNPNLTLTLPGSLLEFGVSNSSNNIKVANLNILANPNNKELKINYLSSSYNLRPINITNQLFIDRNVNTTSTLRDYFICQDLVFGETADAEITMSSHPQCKTLHVGASVKKLGTIISSGRLTFSEGIKTISEIKTSPAVVKLPASLESVGSVSSKIEELILTDGPNPITIGSVYKKNLKSVYMGRDIATDGAFSDSPVLESLIIGDEVTTIGKQMFKNCSAMTSAVMSDNVSTIGEEAFYGCTGLDVLSISANVKEIGTNAYANCNNFSRIVARGTVPPEGNAGFGMDVEDNVPLYVPEEALDDYMASDLFYPFYTIESFNDNVVEEITTEDTLDEEFTVGSQFNICDYIKVIIKFFGGKIKPHMAAPMYAGMMRAPSAATDYSDRLRWFSPNPHIASVDQDGNVTINGEGQAEIRAYVLDGSDRMLSIGVNQLTTGDLNNDGLIDAADLQILVNYVAGGDKTSSRSDVNSDGEIDAADIQILINKITE